MRVPAFFIQITKALAFEMKTCYCSFKNYGGYVIKECFLSVSIRGITDRFYFLNANSLHNITNNNIN